MAAKQSQLQLKRDLLQQALRIQEKALSKSKVQQKEKKHSQDIDIEHADESVIEESSESDHIEYDLNSELERQLDDMSSVDSRYIDDGIFLGVQNDKWRSEKIVQEKVRHANEDFAKRKQQLEEMQHQLELDEAKLKQEKLYQHIVVQSKKLYLEEKQKLIEKSKQKFHEENHVLIENSDDQLQSSYTLAEEDSNKKLAEEIANLQREFQSNLSVSKRAIMEQVRHELDETQHNLKLKCERALENGHKQLKSSIQDKLKEQIPVDYVVYIPVEVSEIKQELSESEIFIEPAGDAGVCCAML